MGAVATEGSRSSGSAEPRSRRQGAPERRPGGEGPTAERLFEPGGLTLEDAVLGAWEELLAAGRAECPVCGGEMSLLAGCEVCGSELS